MKKTLLIVMLGLFSFMLFAEECPFHNKKNQVPVDAKEPQVHCSNLPKPGKTIQLSDGNEMTWEFADKVKMGPNVLKVTIEDKKKLDLKNYTIKANLDMPSMKGAHSSGAKKMILNKKGDFVTPMDFVMRGEWEVCIEIYYKDKLIMNGKYNLNL